MLGLSGAEGSKQGTRVLLARGSHPLLCLGFHLQPPRSLSLGSLELLFKKYSDYFSGPGKLLEAGPTFRTQTCNSSRVWSRCRGLVQKSAKPGPALSALPLPGPGCPAGGGRVPDPLTPQELRALGGSRCPWGGGARAGSLPPGPSREGPGQGLGPRLPQRAPSPTRTPGPGPRTPSSAAESTPNPGLEWRGGKPMSARATTHYIIAVGPHWSGARPWGTAGLAASRARRALALGLRTARRGPGCRQASTSSCGRGASFSRPPHCPPPRGPPGPGSAWLPHQLPPDRALARPGALRRQGSCPGRSSFYPQSLAGRGHV